MFHGSFWRNMDKMYIKVCIVIQVHVCAFRSFSSHSQFTTKLLMMLNLKSWISLVSCSFVEVQLWGGRWTSDLWNTTEQRGQLWLDNEKWYNTVSPHWAWPSAKWKLLHVYRSKLPKEIGRYSWVSTLAVFRNSL